MNFIKLNKLELINYYHGYLKGQLDILLYDFIISDDEIQELIRDTLQTIDLKIKIDPFKYISHSEYITLDELQKVIHKVQNEIIKGV